MKSNRVKIKLKKVIGGIHVKKLWVLFVLLAFVVFATVPVFAAAAKPLQVKVVKRTHKFYKEYHNQELHRVVTGYAQYSLGPNFYNNDWDRGSLSGLTQDEINYLKSLTGFSAKVRYYIDVTGKVCQTSPFYNHSEEVSRNTSFEIKREYLNPYMIIETYIYKTVVYFNDVKYVIVANVYDYSPLVLDLDDNGKIDTAFNDWQPHSPKFYVGFAKFFDITGDGNVDFTEWIAKDPKDGLLVMPDKDGKVETALQLFGTAGGYTDGYEKLSLVCDKDKNGWVEGKELEGLAIWVDENNNAKCEPNELKSLSEYGIVKISTKHHNFVSEYVTSDGKTHKMWDWWPAVKEVRMYKR